MFSLIKKINVEARVAVGILFMMFGFYFFSQKREIVGFTFIGIGMLLATIQDGN